MPAFIIRPSPDLLKVHPELRHISHALVLQYAFQEKVVTDKELENIGSRLWQAIGMTAGFNEARLQAGTAPLDIIIESDSPAIQQLPWETLHHPELGFLGRHENFTLSRRLSAAPTTAPLCKEPLRVLLFSALPDDLDAETGRLNSEEEQAQVLEAFLPWIQEGKVKLETPEDGQFATLQANLDEFKPHLVFLSGHGKFHHEPHTGEAPYGTFLFEGENGESVAIPDGQIAQAFACTSVQCVVLSACESGKSASVELNNGLSYQLAAQGIPQVVGMRESIMDVAGIQFARAFCDGLLAAQGVGQALQAARMAITQPLKDEYQGNARYKLLAELSYGQWCLPSLLSQNPASLLVDWDFIAEPLPDYTPHIRLENITLPQQFFGRRRELRELRRMIRANVSGHVLVTGAGGMGKTALAGKLADSLRKQDYHVFAWSAVNPETWVALAQQMVETLQYHNKEEFERESKYNQAPADYARLLLRLVMRQHNNRAVVFLDNLESVQDSQTLAIQHPELQAWLDVAHSMGRDAPHFILTSRWKMSEWADDAHYQLITPLYGDFLQFAQRQNLPKDFLKQRDRLHQLYTTFGGNFRAVEFFAHASQDMSLTEERVFLDRLKGAEAEIQTDISVKKILAQCTAEEHRIFRCLMIYKANVPLKGISVLAPKATNDILNKMTAKSLIYESRSANKKEYQISPLVCRWISQHKPIGASQSELMLASEFLLSNLKDDNLLLENMQIIYPMLLDANLKEKAIKVVLTRVVPQLKKAGLHNILLNKWLLPMLNISSQEVRSLILNNIGEQYLQLCLYKTALGYFEEAIEFQGNMKEEISRGIILNNISLVYMALSDYNGSLDLLREAYNIQIKIGDIKGQGRSLNNMSIIYSDRGDLRKSIEFAKKAATLQDTIGDIKGKGRTLGNIAAVYAKIGDHDNATFNLKSSLEIAKKSSDVMGEHAALTTLSTLYSDLGNYETALYYMQQLLTSQQQISDKAGEARTLNNMAQVYDSQGKYDNAIDYLKHSLIIRKEINDKKGEGIVVNNISHIYYIQGNLDLALKYLEDSLSIYRQIEYRSGEIISLNNISQIYQSIGNHNKALQYLKIALGLERECGDKNSESVILNNISQIYTDRGDDKTALAYLKQSLSIQRQVKNISGLCAALFNIGQIYYRSGNFDDAMKNWGEVYLIAKESGEAEALQALKDLAENIGLSGGLAAWESLSRKVNSQNKINSDNGKNIIQVDFSKKARKNT